MKVTGARSHFRNAGLGLLLSVLCVRGEAVGVPDLPKLAAPPEVKVNGERVYLGTLVSSEKADDTLIEQLNNTLVTSAPAPGKSKVVEGKEICRLLRTLGVTSEKYSIRVPEVVTIVRGSQTVTFQEIRAKISSDFLTSLRWQDVRLEKVDIPEPVVLPLGTVSLTFECSPHVDLARPFYLGVNFVVDGQVAKRCFFRTELVITDTVAVAVEDLAPSQKIEEAMVQWEKRRVSSTLRAPVRRADFLVGRRPRATIPAGRVLTQDQCVAVPLIKRGDSIALVFQDKQIRINTVGKSLSSGMKGERIRVLNLDSKKELLAEVVDAKTARITF